MQAERTLFGAWQHRPVIRRFCRCRKCAFDGAVSLETTLLCRAVKPKSCSTPRDRERCTPSRAARRMEGWPYIRPEFPSADAHRLYTAVSRALLFFRMQSSVIHTKLSVRLLSLESPSCLVEQKVVVSALLGITPHIQANMRLDATYAAWRPELQSTPSSPCTKGEVLNQPPNHGAGYDSRACPLPP